MNKLFLLLVLCTVAVNARWSLNYQGKAEGDDGHDHDEMDWWEHSTFYQIYPKSFKDSDGDGVGDLKGIISKLPHLAELGVTGAWLSPIFASPMKDGGYDISDFDKVDPMFGTNKDLEDLFAEAEKLGIKIILDLVPNHTSDQHEWFKKSVARETGYEDYYVWTDCPLEVDGTRRYFNNWIAVFHTVAWTYNAQRNQCYLHQFTPEQPDLNYRNEKVVDEMMNVFKVWLDRGADGFRVDAINHMYEAVGLPSEEYVDANGDKTVYDNLVHDQTMNRPESYEFIYKLRTMMDEYSKTATKKHTRLMMTEAYASIENQVKWYGKDEKNQGGHWPFNFALIIDLNKNSTAQAFHNAAMSWINAMPTYGMANWVLGNHDRPRVGYRYGEDRHESIAIMSMGLPGNNVIYYGEEILMTNNMNITFEESDDPQARQTNETVYLQYSRDPVRTPFQWDDTDWAGFSTTTGKTWLPVHADYKTQNLAAQKTAAKSTFKLYQKLLKIRKDNHVLQSGGFESKAVSENVYGYMRTLAKHDTVAVLLNLGEATKVNLKDLMGDEFNDKVKAKILIVNNNSTLVEGQMVGDVQSIELGKYDAVMLEVSSATKIAVSLLLLMCSLIKFIF